MNIHTLKATQESFFFDILAPPYNEAQGRSCSFYKIVPLDADVNSKKIYMASKYSADDFTCIAVPYHGPSVLVQ